MSIVYKAAVNIQVGKALVRPGEIVPWDELNARDRKMLVDGGHVRVVGAALDAPHKTQALRFTEDANLEIKENEGPPPVPTAPGLWSLDPNDLQDREVVDLQVLIAERDPNVAPPGDREGCIAILTKDWVPANGTRV